MRTQFRCQRAAFSALQLIFLIGILLLGAALLVPAVHRNGCLGRLTHRTGIVKHCVGKPAIQT